MKTNAKNDSGRSGVTAKAVPPVQEMGILVNQAPTSVSTISKWMRSDALLCGLDAPLWDAQIVRDTYDEINTLVGSGTSAPPLDLLPYDCFIKAAHMTQWYTNTVALWRTSLNGLDYGEYANKQTMDGILGALNTRTKSLLVGRLWAYARYGLMEKFCKWATATLWASMLRQTELPPTPDFVVKSNGSHLTYLFDNSHWNQLCSSIQKSSDKNRKLQLEKIMITLTKDIYMTKNASLAVDNSFVKENLEKHKKIMCEPMAEDPLSDRMEELMFEAIQQCADDIFGRLPIQDDIVKTVKGVEKTIKTVPLEVRPPSRLPSLGASVNSNRAKGGAAGDLLRSHGEKYLLPEPQSGYLHSYCTYKTLYTDVRTPHDPELYSEAEKASRLSSFTRSSVEAQVVPLLEAFKVRTITKGDADQYHLARRWQKVIHGIMRRQQNCRLIGQPCNSAYLSQIFGNSPYFPIGESDGFFVSGDYESATDLLHPHLSEVANEAIAQRLRIPLEDQWVLKQCLTGHDLKYEAKGSLHKQQWGQLMGSPSSFPILCLINLAATKVAYEVYFRSIGKLEEKEYCVLEELPMCVNGDDILYWCYSQEHYTCWKEVTKECGLKFSLGKNYTHKYAAIINSELYFHTGFLKSKGPNGGYINCLPKRTSTIFRKTGALCMPDTLFYKQASVNSRLLIGGQRSTGAGTQSLVAICDKSDYDLKLILAQLHELKQDIATYTKVKLTPKQQKTHRSLPDDWARAKFIQDVQKDESGIKSENVTEYVKWRTTLEARGRKGLEMCAGDHDVETSRPAMMGALRTLYNRIQLGKLKRFQQIGLSRADICTPHYLPQSLGGLGLIPPPDHKFTLMEYMEVATLEGCPHAAEGYIKRTTPTMPKPSFMKALSHELSVQQDMLNIKPEFKELEDIGLLRFFGEEDAYWEHTFLTGFVTHENMIVDPQEVGECYAKVENIQRAFKSQSLMQEKKRQIKHARLLGICKVVKDESSGKSKMVATEGETCFEKIDFASISIYRKYRPSPKYE